MLVVHHARKDAGNARAGQALRGSSEFHASCRRRVSDTTRDSNLYLRRDGDDLSLTVGHRAAASLDPIAVALTQRGPALALEAVLRSEPTAAITPPPNTLDDRIIADLAETEASVPFIELRAHMRVRAATLYERIAALTVDGRITKTATGYRRAGG